MIKVNETSLPRVLLIERTVSVDPRGRYCEIYQREPYNRHGIDMDFVEDDYSFSRFNTLRGLHGDEKTWKLVSCPFGKLFLAVVNYDPSSEYFGRVETFILTPENGLQVLIPPMHINGHYVMSPDGAMFHYKQSEYYSGACNQFSVRWNDSRFTIPWPFQGEPFLSERDKGIK